MPTEAGQVQVAILSAASSTRRALHDALSAQDCLVTNVDSELALLKVTKEWGWHESVIALVDIADPPIDPGFILDKLKVSSRTNHIFIAVIAEEDGRDDAVTYLDHGASDWLIKPFDDALLKARLSTYV